MALPDRNRFKTLVRVRKRQEDRQAQELSVLHRQIQAAEVERGTMERHQIDMLKRAAELTREKFDATDIQRYYQYERHLSRLVAEKDAEIAELSDAEAEKRLELQEAMKRRRMAERLDERREEAFDAVVRKNSQKLSDEIAVTRAWMKERRIEP